MSGSSQSLIAILAGTVMRLEIDCQDRLGITSDVLSLLVEHDINLRGIEINSIGKLYVHFPTIDFDELQTLMPKIRRIGGIGDVKTTPFMPSEKRSSQLDAMIETMPGPVFSLDVKGCVTNTNKAALSSLESSTEELFGQEMSSLIKGFGFTQWLERNPTEAEAARVKFIQQDYEADIVPVVVSEQGNQESTPILSGAVVILRSEAASTLPQEVDTQSEDDSFSQFVQASNSMKKAVREAKQLSDLDAPLLIFGETGTGKETMAKACHKASRRAQSPFSAINCSSLPQNIIDSELFGYEAGHLNQTSGKDGLLETVGNGTLLIDGIDHISDEVQNKLVRVIETGEFSRIGSSDTHTTKARLVFSTNNDLGLLVEEGKFRKDLYYKINVLSLLMPPLRERRQDIVELAELFIGQHSAKLVKRPAKLSRTCVDFLQQYPWPGNVRQLQNTLFRAVSLLDSNEITKEDVQLPSCGPSITYIDENFDGTLDQEVKKFERDLLRRLYPSYPSTRQLAKKLGLSHTAIANKLREYGINKGTVKL